MSWLRNRLAGVERRNLIIAILSVVVTSIGVFAFLIESRFGYMKPDPIIVYAENWEDGRSRDDVLAARAKEAAERERLEAEKARQQKQQQPS